MDEFFDSFDNPQAKETLARRKMLQNMTRLQDGEKTAVARRYEVRLARSLQRNLQLYRELQAMTAEEDNPSAN